MDRQALDSGIVQARETLIRTWEGIKQALLAPGEQILDWVIVRAPHIVESLAVQSADDARILAAALSLVFWTLAAVLIKAVYNVIRNATLCVASLYRRSVSAAAYRLRMIGRAITAPVRRIDVHLARRKLHFIEEFEISELQLAILRAQSTRPPGHAITAIEAAEELNIRPLRAQQALSSLTALHLMEVSFATSDGCPGYFLTRPGEVYLVSCNTRGQPEHDARKAPA